jgi:hypothetical protein
MRTHLDQNETHLPRDNAPSEQVLNSLLRRADWRFLLPNPEPHVSICFARGLLAKAVQAISDCTVNPQDATPGVCDLTVAIDPDQKTLGAAWEALRTGGACYTEWYSPLHTNPRIVKEKLSAMGFENVTCYWAWPLPARAPALFWLPVEATGAIHFFMTHRTPDKSIARHWVRALLRFLWRGARGLGIIGPICAVARKPVRYGPSLLKPDLKPALLDFIRASWDKWGLGGTPERLSWLLLTEGNHSRKKAVGLVFAEPDTQPRIAVKMPRVASSIPGLLNEKTTLEYIQAFRQNDLCGIPRVLFCEQWDSLVFLGETALTGVPLYTKLNRSNFHQLVLEASNWQIKLAGHNRPIPSRDWWKRIAEPAFEVFSESFGDVIDDGMLRTAREILAALGSLPRVCEQRDFSPWNVMVTADEQLAILDWESAELNGLPATDLIYFLAYAGFFLDGAWQSGRFRESYRASLDRFTFTGAVHAEAMAQYVAQVDIDISSLRALRLLTWMVHARSEYRRLVGRWGNRPPLESLRRSLFLNLWEEELR